MSIARIDMTLEMFVTGSSQQILAAYLPPRALECSKAGFFTQLELVGATSDPPLQGDQESTLGQIQVCCTTDVIVEGYGNIGAPCISFGEGEFQGLLYWQPLALTALVPALVCENGCE
jgi:hypothetical protein